MTKPKRHAHATSDGRLGDRVKIKCKVTRPRPAKLVKPAHVEADGFVPAAFLEIQE